VFLYTSTNKCYVAVGAKFDPVAFTVSQDDFESENAETVPFDTVSN